MEGYNSAAALMRSVASLAAPLRCVVCGGAAGPRAAWPLCPDCASAIIDEGEAMSRERRCAVCGKPLISERVLCLRCRGAGFAFDSAWPLWRYDGDIRAVLLAYKAGRRRSLAGFLAGAVARAAASRFPGRVIVPVPPRPGKVRRKGWDQVEDMARLLEKRHGLTVARLLVRADGLEQKALDLAGRAANMKGRISTVRGAAVPADPVILDDVLTTGATLSACAGALRLAGAIRVDAIAIAAD